MIVHFLIMYSKRCNIIEIISPYSLSLRQDEPAQLDQCNEEHRAPAEHLGQTTTVNENSAMDFSLSDTKPPKRVRKRQKDGTKEEEDLFRRDALNSLLIAEQISVGRLHVTVDKPVEVDRVFNGKEYESRAYRRGY